MNQFIGSSINISLLKRGERYRCNKCNLNFVQQDSLDFYNSGAVVDARIPQVYCPICTSCHLRFLPAIRAFEDLAVESQPYSLVTVLDSDLQSPNTFSNILKTCIVASLTSMEIEASTSVTYISQSEKKTKVNLDDNIRNKYIDLINQYKKFALQLAVSQFGNEADPKIPNTYHVPEQHKKLGIAISDAYQVLGTLSKTYIEKIIVVPSIEHISSLIMSNVYSKDELIEYANAPIFGE